MPAVRISSIFQIEIPREVREQLPLAAGQEVEVFVDGGQIRIFPIRPVRELRGSMPGLDTAVDRGPDRL